MKRIAITGVSGYIGSKLLSRLDKSEFVDTIVGIDVKPPKIDSRKLKFYCQDISKPFDAIFIENKVDSAVHLAFVLKPTHDKRNARQVDIAGMMNFRDACNQTGVRHILYLSSHTVYGANPDNPPYFDEDSTLRPLSGFQYSEDKVEAEGILTDFARSDKNIRLTIIRSCPVIGPDAKGSIVNSMFTPVMIRIAGYDPSLQFIHEDDLVELMIAFIKGEKAGVFNAAGNGEIRYSETAVLAKKKMLALPGSLLYFLLRWSWALRLQSESPTSGLEFIKYPPLVSTGKVKTELGFQFRHSSKEAAVSFLSTL